MLDFSRLPCWRLSGSTHGATLELASPSPHVLGVEAVPHVRACRYLVGNFSEAVGVPTTRVIDACGDSSVITRPVTCPGGGGIELQ